MPFGLGFGELLVTLIVLGVLVALILLVARGVLRITGLSRNSGDLEIQRLATELQQAQRRIGELEAKLTRMGENSSASPTDS